MKPDARQRGRAVGSLFRRLLLGLALFAVAVAAIVLGRDVVLDWDRIHIEAERSRRLSQFALGLALPGTPDVADLDGRLAAHDLKLGAPVFMRIFKREFELELWMKRGEGFHRFATYPVCRWSGRLGPKLEEGDGQAPEGIYTVDSKALNPASRWHRSFNLGFPNAFDRVHRRSGSYLMVHGGCTSIGCFAMTDAVIDEIWRLVTAALKAGQARFHVHVYPFRMTEENLALRGHVRWQAFWQELKRGHDLFEATLLPPKASVCRGGYSFAAGRSGSDGSHEIESGCMELTRVKG